MRQQVHKWANANKIAKDPRCGHLFWAHGVPLDQLERTKQATNRSITIEQNNQGETWKVEQTWHEMGVMTTTSFLLFTHSFDAAAEFVNLYLQFSDAAQPVTVTVCSHCFFALATNVNKRVTNQLDHHIARFNGTDDKCDVSLLSLAGLSGILHGC